MGVRAALRLRTVQTAFGIGLLAVLVRAIDVQLVRGGRYAEIAEAQRTDRVSLPARRGAIYDRNGVTFALTQEVFHVDVARNELCPPRIPRCSQEQKIADIARHLGLTPRVVRRALQDGYGYFHGPFSSVQVEPLRAIRGVHLSSELVRFHPAPELARSVLGRPASDGRPASGIERVLDSLLTGRDGSAVVIRDRQGQRYESPSRLGAFPVAGHDVFLTLDAELQELVEQALTDAIERYDALGGDVVVLHPSTGEVLALASLDADGRRTSSAFTSVFEPGSTAKLFAAAALLASGLAQPGDSVWTELGAYELGRRTIRDEHPHAWLSFQQVIEQSSNIGIVKLASRLTPATQFAMLRAVGLGSPTGVEYPVESGGLLRAPHQWSGTTAASLAMGYEVAVTPLQLAQAYAAIANDGVLMRPTVVREVRAPNGRVVQRHVPEPVRRAFPPEVSARLRQMLRGVVYREGTGSTAALTAYEVAGKTGTARRAGPDGYIAGSYTSSFASLFPAERPQMVMVVKLDDPKLGYARLTAAPVTREVLQQLLASRTGALDRSDLTSTPLLESPRAPERLAASPAVLPWPIAADANSTAPRVVPDVRGLGLREAAHRLHVAGLRVRLRGWGTVSSTTPSAGTPVPRGSLVTVSAQEPGR